MGAVDSTSEALERNEVMTVKEESWIRPCGAVTAAVVLVSLVVSAPVIAGQQEVEKRTVSFWSDGTRLAGDLYLPKDRKADEKLPAILLCNGWGGVKTRMETWATRFAQSGFVAFAFDYRGWGESDSKLVLKEKMPKPDARGEITARAQAIREVVDPMDEAWDIRCAISFLMGEPAVDTGRVGLWGTSYGGGLVTWIAARDSRIKCVVAQVPGLGGNRGAAAVQRAYARLQQQARGEIGPIPQDYDQVPKLRGCAHVSRMVDYKPLDDAARVNAPILFIDAENEELMDRRLNGQKAYETIKSKGTVPVKYHVVKGITHFQIYREGFDQAATLALDWFAEHLKQQKRKDQPAEQR